MAYDFFFGGHLGVRKMEERIDTNFLRSGLHEDVTSFYRFGDVCQKIVPRNSASRVPLEGMFLINLLKRVAIDLVGPIAPASD